MAIVSGELLQQQANSRRLNGMNVVDGDGINWFLWGSFDEVNQPNFTTDNTLVGGVIETHRKHDHRWRTGPSAVWPHTWTNTYPFVIDDTLRTTLMRQTMPSTPANMHHNLLEMEFFDGGGTGGPTEFYLYREALGTGYSQSGTTGLGVNSGSAAEHLVIYNRGTGATLADSTAGTLYYDRTLQVLDFAGLAADGDTVTVTVTPDGGSATATVLTAVAGAPGANEFQCITDDDTTASNLATAIAAISGVGATATTDTVTVTKDTGTATVTLATSDDGTDLDVHPIGTEWVLDTQSTDDAWANLVTGTAPASTPQNIIRVEYQALYNVTVHLSGNSFPAGKQGTLYTAGALNMREKGRFH